MMPDVPHFLEICRFSSTLSRQLRLIVADLQGIEEARVLPRTVFQLELFDRSGSKRLRSWETRNPTSAVPADITAAALRAMPPERQEYSLGKVQARILAEYPDLLVDLVEAAHAAGLQDGREDLQETLQGLLGLRTSKFRADMKR